MFIEIDTMLVNLETVKEVYIRIDADEAYFVVMIHKDGKENSFYYPTREDARGVVNKIALTVGAVSI